MASPIGSLYGQLGLDWAEWRQGVKGAKNELAGLGKTATGAAGKLNGFGKAFDSARVATLQQFAPGADRFATALGHLGTAGLAAGFGIAAVIGAAVQARQAFTFADDIADQASRLAVSTDTLQEYRFAIHALGGDYTDADKALEGFSKTFGMAQAGFSKKAVKPFEALGLDPKSFATTDEALAAVIDKISQLSSSAEQAAIADKLGISDILPAARAGTASIDALRESAHRLGYVMDADLVQKGGEANDKMEDMSRILDVQVKSAFVNLAPQILAATQKLVDFTVQLNEATKNRRFEITMNIVKNELTGPKKLAAVMPVGLLAVGAGAYLENRRLDQLDRDTPFSDNGRRGRVTRPVIRQPESRLTPPSSGDGKGGADKAKARAKASEAAIEAALRDQLAAQLASTKNIEEIAEIKMRQIDLETAASARRLEQDAAEGRITPLAAQRATEIEAQVAAEKKRTIETELLADLVEQEVRFKETLRDLVQRQVSAAAEMAGTAAARHRIEMDALAADQFAERERLQNRADIGAEEKKQLGLELDKTQATERELAERRGRDAALREATELVEAGLVLQGDLLAAEEANKHSVLGRRDAALRLLDLEYDIERLRLEEILASETATNAQREIARNRLAQLPVLQKADEDAIKAQYRWSDAFNEGARNAQDIVSAFESEDWVGLASALGEAFTDLKEAFDTTGNALGKIGAVAGVASAAGQAVGGKAGSALSSAAAGAMLGAQVGSIVPVIGTVVGAIGGFIIGGLGGLLGGGGSKKKAEARRRAEEEAARKALEIANQKRELEIRIMELAGDAAGALAARREDEVAATDASNQELVKRVHALEDEAEAAAKASAQWEFFTTTFLSAAQQIAPTQAAVTAEMERLGLASIDTRQEFADLVMGLDRGTEGGQALYRALMAIAPQFAEVIEHTEQLAEEQTRLAEASAALRREHEQAFEAEFLTDTARLAPVLRDVRNELADMGLYWIRTREQFASLVTVLRGMGAEMEPALARLLALAPAFDEVMDHFDAQFGFFADNFLTSAQRLDSAQQQLTLRLGALSAQFGRADLAALSTHDEFADLVLSLDNQSPLYQALMDLAPLFDEVADAAAGVAEQWAFFTSEFLSEAEQMRPAQQRLVDGLTALGLQAVDTRAEFAAALQAAPPGSNLQKGLLALLADADAVFDYLEQLAAEAAETAETVEEAVEEIDNSEALARIEAARDMVSRAYDKEADALTRVRDRMKGFSDGLRQLLANLSTGALARLSPEAAYRAAQAQFAAVQRAIAGGDAEAAEKAESAIQGLLEASQAFNASGAGYFADLAASKDLALDAAELAEEQVDIAQAQLDSNLAMVAGILDVEAAILSLPAAIAQFMLSGGTPTLAPLDPALTAPSANDNAQILLLQEAVVQLTAANQIAVTGNAALVQRIAALEGQQARGARFAGRT